MLNETRWPQLHAMVQEGGVQKIDIALASFLLKGHPACCEDMAAFIVKLSLSARKGHMCLKFDEGSILPRGLDLIDDREMAERFDQMAERGFMMLPKELIASPYTYASTSPLIEDRGYVYFQKNAFLEKRFFDHLLRISEAVCVSLEAGVPDVPLLKAQSLALRAVFCNTLTIITGGPGTGKTYTAAQIVGTFYRSYKEEYGSNPSIILSAPTGRAAAHLEKNVRKHLSDAPDMRCGTLHLLLSIKSSEDMMGVSIPLYADLMIIDEASMIDARLFSYLLSCLQEGTRVVIMGDRHQLPPVESGSLFSDLIDLSKRLPKIACVELKECMRSDKEEILSFAEAVNQGDEKRAQEMLSVKSGSLTRSDICNTLSAHPLEVLWQQCLSLFAPACSTSEDLFTLVQHFDAFRILCAMRQGPIGVDAINRYFLSKYMQEVKEGEMMLSPILITKNDYSLDLFNGDTGVLIQKKKQGKNHFLLEDKALFLDKEGSVLSIPALALPSFEYAYCLSIHKSQGSEYDRVFVLMQEGSEVFGKESLYTAVTRAKSSLTLAISDHTLQKTLQKSSRKMSGLI